MTDATATSKIFALTVYVTIYYESPAVNLGM